MLVRLTLIDRDGLRRDVGIHAAAGTTIADLAELARWSPAPGERSGPAAATPGMWSGTRRLPPAAVIGGPGLRDGDVVHVGTPGPPDLAAGVVRRLDVVCGPDAGTTVPLPRGAVLTIGRAPDCDVVLSDPDASRRHASVTVTSAGVVLRDLDSTNGTHLAGSLVDGDGLPLAAGDLIRLGDSFLSVSGAEEPAAAVRAGPDGTRQLNRPPRLGALLPEREITLPAQQAVSGPPRIQWLGASIPAVVGAVLAMVMHNGLFLAFALMSPVMIVGTAAGERLHWRRSRRRDAAQFDTRQTAALVERDALLAEELAHRRRAHPDPAALLRSATLPDCRLWERRRADHDVLDVRLGLADLPAALVERRGSSTRPAGVLASVPLTVTLRDGPLGLAGPRGMVLGTARWVLAQLIGLHSPDDVQVALLLSDTAAAAWTWARWAPHLAGRIATTADDRTALVGDLLRLVDERVGSARPEQAWPGPWTVLVVDRAGALADLPGLSRVLAGGPAVGITAVCLDEHERLLPTTCAALGRVSGAAGSRITIRRQDAAIGSEAVADRVGAKWAERLSRALAPLSDAAADVSTTLPGTCRLLGLVELEDPTPEAIRQRWRAGGRPATVVGVGADGPVVIDLVRDGPHTLVAGTTGSGKSELLQTLIAGLAVANSPADLSFVLIDYKGGAAFADCARLPHTSGLVTDLDPHLTQRALRSLNAELRRREELFSRAGAHDLDSYRLSAQYRSCPLGRLVLIVDEFAALAEELPDFVSGLVGIAQRGRSLGVHLVLATQRPGGVVSPEIRANTTLRIALRVTDPAESADVIGTDHAAKIDKNRPGRAYLRTGDVLRQIQTARVGVATAISGPGPRVVGLDEWGRAAESGDATIADRTDLQLLADALRETAGGAEDSPTSATARAHSATVCPWLPPLPTQVGVTALPPALDGEVPIGLIDLPDQQAQHSIGLDVECGGPVLFVGTARTGRTSILLTATVAAAQRYGVDDLHVYAVDSGGTGLCVLGEIPHTAAVATPDDPSMTQRIIDRLGTEIATRRAVVAQLGVGTVAEARRQGSPLPLLLVLVDGWESFVAASDDNDGGRAVEALLTIMRESSALGITVLVTGDRSALAARVSGTVARKYLLRLADQADYAMAGLTGRPVPGSMPPGRGVRAEDGAEVQFAHLGADPSPGERRRVLSDLAARSRCEHPGGHSGRHPVPIRTLPGAVPLAGLGRPGPRCTLLGVGGDAAAPVHVDLFAGEGRWLIAGPPRSGRSTALRVILRQAAAAGVDTVLAAPPRSPLAHDAARDGVAVLGPDASPAVLEARSGPTLFLVDDVESLLDTPLGDALAERARRTLDDAFVVAGRSEELVLTYRGIGAEVRRARTGILLQPGPGDGDLLGIRLARARPVVLPGRGLLVADQVQLAELGPDPGAVAIQVALP